MHLAAVRLSGRMVSISTVTPQRDDSTTARIPLRSRRGVRLAGLLQMPAGVMDLGACATVVLCHGMESTQEGTKHTALAARLRALRHACGRIDLSYVREAASGL